MILKRTIVCLLTVLVLLVPGFLWADNLFDLIAANAGYWKKSISIHSREPDLREATEQLTVEDIKAAGAQVNDRCVVNMIGQL